MTSRILFVAVLWLLCACLQGCHQSPPPPFPPQTSAVPQTTPSHDTIISRKASSWLKAWLKSPSASSGRLTTRDLLRPFLQRRQMQGREQIRVLLEYTGALQKLKTYGCAPGPRLAGRFVSAWCESGKLASLLRRPHLVRASFSRWLKPHLKISGPAIHAPQIRYKHKLDGRGVIVGLIDTGIDITHPAFRHQDGSTRLLRLMDFSLLDEEGKPTVFTSSDIDKQLAQKVPPLHQDIDGHGTHIAGIAAGGPYGPKKGQTAYIGIAPRSDIVVVKAQRKGRSDFSSADVLSAIVFIHRTAQQRRQPYVINISLGGHQGGHDGNAFLERAIDALSGTNKKGQIFVASAGNEGNQAIHASGWLQETNSTDIRVQLTRTATLDPKARARLSLELWYAAQDTLTIAVRSPNGHTLGPYEIAALPQSPTPTPDGWVGFSHRRQESQPASQSLSLTFGHSDGDILQAGEWTLQIAGKSKRFDAWIAESTRSIKARFLDHVRQEVLLGVPGTAKGTITVGSYNSRRGWKQRSGALYQGKEQLAALSYFSSPGPTRDGRPKPEIVAPGSFILSAASVFANPSQTLLSEDGPYLSAQGTSQAAPHVAGGIALLLQQDRTLDSSTLKQILQRSAASPDQEPHNLLYQEGWGFGRLHLERAFTLLQHSSSNQAKGSVDASTSTIGSLWNAIPADGRSTTTLYLIPKNASGIALPGPHRLTLKSTAGSLGPPKTESPGIYTVQLRASETPTKAEISVSIDGQQLPYPLYVDFLPSAHWHQSRGCGCDIHDAIQHPSSWHTLFLMLLCCLWISRRPSR